MARRSVPGRAEADNDSLFPFLSPVRGFGLSRRVHKNDLGGFDRRDFNSGFARDCDAVTLADMLVIHHDSSTGGYEIAVSLRWQGICDALSGLDCRAEYPGVCINLQRVLVLGESARQWHEAPGALRVRKGFGSPAGIYSTATGQQPDLKNPQRHIAVVVFGMPD